MDRLTLCPTTGLLTAAFYRIHALDCQTVVWDEGGACSCDYSRATPLHPGSLGWACPNGDDHLEHRCV